MDNLTHTLFAATLARTRLARAGRGTTAALLLASNAPDIDIVTTARGTMSYVHWHRGPTHGVLGVFGLGVLSAAIVWAAGRVFGRRGREREGVRAASLAMLVAISTLAVGLHVLMDLPTTYGTRLLSPFDWRWHALDWLPIIDIYLLAALAIGLIFGSISSGLVARRRGAASSSRARFATVVLVLMAVNYGVRASAHHEALALAPGLFGRLLPPPCNPDRPLSQGTLEGWPSDRDSGMGAGRPAASPCLVEIAAMPTFLSPFRWRVIARLSNAYELHDVDLLEQRLGSGAETQNGIWRLAVRYPDQWTAATARAAEAPDARLFLGFSRFPAARTFTDRATGVTTVRWTDVRFEGGIASLGDRSRRPNPFNLTVRVDANGRVVDEHPGTR